MISRRRICNNDYKAGGGGIFQNHLKRLKAGSVANYYWF
ncbi:hypothetical protein J2T20_005159 [Paenibacillus wynnii]|nr:hypothetical protein [Paenibacillus wynnii]